jgi:hypothetical protein
LKKNLETDPVGDRYALLPDQTWPNYDEVSYGFPAAMVVDATPDDAGDDVMTLSVRLLYVVNTPEYVQFLVDENQTNEAGQTVADLFAGLGPVVPLELAAWSQMVPLRGLDGALARELERGVGELRRRADDRRGGELEQQRCCDEHERRGGRAPRARGPGSGQSGDGGGGCGCRTSGPLGGLGGLALLGAAASASASARLEAGP